MSEYKTGAPQPPKSAAYTAPQNPVSNNPSEQVTAGSRINSDGTTTSPSAQRGPGDAYDSNGGKEWGTGRGERGHDPVDQKEAENTRYVNKGQFATGTDDDEARATVADASQVEGKVMDAVERKSGTQRAEQNKGDGEIGEQDFASDLDRKKAEQAEARKEVKQARQAGEDVDGGSEYRRQVMGDESLVES